MAALEFATAVFEKIAQRFAHRAADIFLMTETESSFEEWCNWEAFVACRAIEGWGVTPKPSYRLERVDSGEAGDLRVNTPDEIDWVFCEIALLTDGNSVGAKWKEKIEHDVTKLKRLGWTVSYPLLVIVAVSVRDIETDTTWARYLNTLPIWGTPAFAHQVTVFNSVGPGKMIVRAYDMRTISA